MGDWKYDWVNNIRLSDNFDLFPIQYANVKRIEHNDAVYIFDEVGCGKTISAGLMALHYLNNRGGDVTVITINSLIKNMAGREVGQFLNDWYEKLPFGQLGYKDRVSAVNNHYKKIKGIKETGLLIIDEAHLFLEEDTERLKELKKIKAEKVVFLTATPIKHGQSDLMRYCEIAKSVLGEDVDKEWLKELVNTVEAKPICARFDLNLPVTRYFKDTVMALEYVENDKIDFTKTKAKRLIPQLWEYGIFSETGQRISKIEALINNICAIRDKDESSSIPSRFVIFTRYIVKEIDKIKIAFDQYKDANNRRIFYDWDCRDEIGSEKALTYICVNGGSVHLATEFGHNGEKEELPDIIVITYQLAEQGLNLPGYNYVINYHIPSYPSSLEQRFGRIDRMGRKNKTPYDEINMAFLVNKSYYDTYTLNFYTALWIYRNSLLTILPAKNVLLTREIMEQLEAGREILQNKINDLRKLCEKDNVLWDVTKKLNEEITISDNEVENLYDFVVEEEIPFNFHRNDEYSIQDMYDLKRAILDELNELEGILKKTGSESNENIQKVIETYGDKIFHIIGDENDNPHFNTYDAISDKGNGCAEIIWNSENYKNYKNIFNQEVKLPKLFEKWADVAEKYFERQFLSVPVENRNKIGGYVGILINIFPALYSELLDKEVLKDVNINLSDRKMLVDNAEDFVQTLPFFEMVNRYREILMSKRNIKDKIQCGDEYSLEKRPERRERSILVDSLNQLIDEGKVPGAIMRKIRISFDKEGNPIIACHGKVKVEETDFFTARTRDYAWCCNWLELSFHCMNRMMYDRTIPKFVEKFSLCVRDTNKNTNDLKKLARCIIEHEFVLPIRLKKIIELYMIPDPKLHRKLLEEEPEPFAAKDTSVDFYDEFKPIKIKYRNKKLSDPYTTWRKVYAQKIGVQSWAYTRTYLLPQKDCGNGDTQDWGGKKPSLWTYLIYFGFLDDPVIVEYDEQKTEQLLHWDRKWMEKFLNDYCCANLPIERKTYILNEVLNDLDEKISILDKEDEDLWFYRYKNDL
ncbi:MAG: hypothetical protein IKP88_00145 [Lachnospiraceae bacterium]|nr:hypothetical protein [Lachnospiraceae bacterium]